MNTKVYVDNLAATATENELLELFSAYGNVMAVSIAVDRSNARPCGFGFVTMATPEGARAAIQALNGKMIGATNLIVSEGWLNEEPSAPPNRRPGPRRRASQLC